MSQPVLLLDDGELDDVQEILEGARVPVARVRGGAIVSGQPPPSMLLVATPRRVDAVGASNGGDDPVRVVVVEEDSPGLRERLRECGFDFLIRRPVHPEALRLLLFHCLYTGEERRREPRLPLGVEVTVKCGLLPRKATLCDLSARGCRLLATFPAETGRRMRVQIPDGLAGAGLDLRGRVVRSEPWDEGDDPELKAVAVMFEGLGDDERRALAAILEACAEGPPALGRPPEPAVRPAARPTSPRPAAPAPETRPAPAAARRRWLREVNRAARPDPRAEIEAEGEIAPVPASASDGAAEEAAPAQASGTAPPPARSVPSPNREEPLADEVEGADDDDRRRQRRGAFDSKVPAFGSRALRVLVGRDLSAGGMRVERSPGLALGDRLHLAIYGEPDEEPFLIWATVARDDGPRGMAIVFDAVHPSIEAKLEKVVGSLPAVESLEHGEAAAMGTVVSEILSG